MYMVLCACVFVLCMRDWFNILTYKQVELNVCVINELDYVLLCDCDCACECTVIYCVHETVNDIVSHSVIVSVFDIVHAMTIGVVSVIVCVIVVYVGGCVCVYACQWDMGCECECECACDCDCECDCNT